MNQSFVSTVLALTLSLTVALPATASRAAPAATEPDDLAGPPPELAPHTDKVALPAVPSFELPATAPGVHGPRELRVRGRRLLGSELVVTGYVTAIYDCVAALAAINPRATRAQITASIDNNPALCEAPKLYLGDAKDTPRDASLLVAELPRAPSKAERQKLTRAELAALPPVPKLAVGDHVAITGTWDVQSAHEHGADGVLVYKSLARATAAAPAAAAPTAPSAAPAELDVVSRPPPRKAVDKKTQQDSKIKASQCSAAFSARRNDDAIAACQAATQIWPGNHLAWYLESSAHMAKDEWPAARAAVEHAVALRPDLAMYQLYLGVTIYEVEHRKPRAATGPAQLQIDPARDALLRAVKLGPELWRAHFYLGRVYRDLDDAPHEAEQLGLTIATHPAYVFGYLAVGDLYRRWGDHDAAIAASLAGTTRVAAADAPELWFAAGLGYEATHADDKAIAAFGQVLAARPDDALAKLHRGQAYVRTSDKAHARADLEAVMASGDPRVASAKPFAAQLLGKLGT